MRKAAGQQWHLSCRHREGCTWSTHVSVPRDADPEPVLLVALRAHADRALHGRVIEGVAVGVNGGVQILVLRHP